MTELADYAPSTPADHQRQIAAWSKGADALKRSLVSLVQPTQAVKLCRIARTADEGAYVVATVAERAFPQTHESNYPARFSKVTLTGKDALDSFFTRGEAWSAYTDAQLYEAAREYAESNRLSGVRLRSLSTYVTLALLARRGVDVKPWQLP
jgi:hypothetical protein